MSIRLVYDFEEVFAYAKEHVPGIARREHMVGIGMQVDGKMVAVAVYENLNQHNVWIHIAGSPGRHWLNRRAIQAAFLYPFNVCGVNRISAYIEASNTRSIRFAEHMGFEREATLQGVAIDGGDAFIYRLFKKDCRYVQLAQN